MSPRRPQRKGEYVCTCDAYRFPHRFGGGRCSGAWVAIEQWENYYGHGEPCISCCCTDGTTCDVYEGVEKVEVCEAWQEFVRINEIKP